MTLARGQWGKRVAAKVEKSVEAVLLYLGCIRAGCVFLPLNPAYQAGELSHLIGDARPTLFVGRPQGIELCRKIPAELGVPHVLAAVYLRLSALVAQCLS